MQWSTKVESEALRGVTIRGKEGLLEVTSPEVMVEGIGRVTGMESCEKKILDFWDGAVKLRTSSVARTNESSSRPALDNLDERTGS